MNWQIIFVIILVVVIVAAFFIWKGQGEILDEKNTVINFNAFKAGVKKTFKFGSNSGHEGFESRELVSDPYGDDNEAKRFQQYRYRNDTGPKVSEMYTGASLGSEAMDSIAASAFKTYTDQRQARLDLSEKEVLREPETDSLTLYKPDFGQIGQPSRTSPFIKQANVGLVIGSDIGDRADFSRPEALLMA